MKKNIFEPHVLDEIKMRVQVLKPLSVAQWGTMNASEMLHHCSESLKQIMHANAVQRPSSIKQNLLRFVFLRILSKFPKGAATRKDLDVKKSTLVVSDFEQELQQFISRLEVFGMQEKIFAMHPYFGNLTRRQWGIFTWMHIDHHLRQFGV
jgi:hypothetical protein